MFTEDFMHSFKPFMLVSDATEWHDKLMQLSGTPGIKYTHIDDMTFVYMETSTALTPICFTVDCVSKFNLDDAVLEKTGHPIIEDFKFMPLWSQDNYGKYPRDGHVVPMDEIVTVCKFISHGYKIQVCGCVEKNNRVHIWAERNLREEPTRVFEEDYFDELGDAFDMILLRLQDAEISLADVEWEADWCMSASAVTGELGAGLFIKTRYPEIGYPYGTGYEGCNDPRRADYDFDSEDEFESETENQNAQNISIGTINIYL